jgi:hypothetical protein
LSSFFELPAGEWEVIADVNSAGTKVIEIVKDTYKAPSISGAVLRRIK